MQGSLNFYKSEGYPNWLPPCEILLNEMPCREIDTSLLGCVEKSTFMVCCGVCVVFDTVIVRYILEVSQVNSYYISFVFSR